MKKYILFVILVLVAIPCANLLSKDAPDSKGTDFWFTYIPNYHLNLGTNDIRLKYGDSIYVYIVADVPTTGTLVYKDRSGKQYTKNISIPDPSIIYIFRLEHSLFELLGFNEGGSVGNRNQSEMIAPNSFHLVTDKDVSVYAHSQAKTTSEAFNVLPTDAIGGEYMILTYNSDDRFKTDGAATPSQFAIVGTQNNTKVTINPSSPTYYNGTKQQNITLNAGDVYLVQSRTIDEMNYDLTSSEILADKPVAVFAGQQRSTLPYDIIGQNASRDCLIEQMLPIQSWGSNALVIPFFQHTTINTTGYYDIYRVLSAYDDTNIYINDTLMIKKNRGEVLERRLINPEKIYSSKPVYVMTYKKTSSVNATGSYSFGDPLMMTIPQVEQFNNNYRFINIQAWEFDYQSNQYAKVYTEQYLGLVASNSALSKINLDGTNLQTSIFKPIPFTTYSYAIIQKMGDGVHSISCPEKFGIYVYGYGRANSYGYFGGMNLYKFDQEAPRLLSNTNCFEMKGYAADTSESDTKISKFYSPTGSQVNVSVNVDQFTPYPQRVAFNAKLQNEFADGKFELFVEDSAGMSNTKAYEIPGFTVGLNSINPLSSRTVALVTDTIPNQKNYCSNVKITNYGHFEQIVTDLKINKNKYFTFSKQPPFILAPGETIDFDVCATFESDTTLIDTLSISGNCIDRPLILFNLTSIEDKSAPKALSNRNPCDDEINIFFADSMKSDLGIDKIDILTKNNCDVNIIAQNLKFVYLKVKVIDPYKDTYVEIKATDKSGFSTTFRDTIPGFTIGISSDDINSADSTGVYYGQVMIGSMKCLSYKLTNFGNYDVTIPDVAMASNIWYSIPLAQFPITIEAGKSKNIDICFRPISYTENRIYDTAAFYFKCLKILVPVSGLTDSLLIKNDTKCEIPIVISALKVPSIAYLQPNKPNPAIDITTIEFGISKTEIVDISIFDLFGNKVQTIVNTTLQAGCFEYKFDTHYLTKGSYFIVMKTEEEKFINKMIITK